MPKIKARYIQILDFIGVEYLATLNMISQAEDRIPPILSLHRQFSRIKALNIKKNTKNISTVKWQNRGSIPPNIRLFLALNTWQL